jgi:hypothetical protein
MALIRPRLNDHHDLPFTQEEVDFAIPFLDEDLPLYVDPFLLWKSPSQQDQSLHLSLLNAFNRLGHLAKRSHENDAISQLIIASECSEAGLGQSRTRQGKRFGQKIAKDILSLFQKLPHIQADGFTHIEETQLYVDGVSKDRISDFTCSFLKSFLLDFTIEQCNKYAIPRTVVTVKNIYSLRTQTFEDEAVALPINPITQEPVLLIPKRWLRFVPWIGYEDYYKNAFIEDTLTNESISREHIAILTYNRSHYDIVQNYIQEKERTAAGCKNDPLFSPIPVLSAKRKLSTIRALPSGKTDNADKKYENTVCQLMASLLYPYLDFAAEQSRTDSGVLIRDLIFYNNRSVDFLKEIHQDYGSRQVVMELKNVKEVEREHINQLNRYLNDHFGKFGIIVTRNRLPKSVFTNTINLWAGQRRCLISLTDEDIALMIDIFENKQQRHPIEVIKKKYVEFIRACPA